MKKGSFLATAIIVLSSWSLAYAQDAEEIIRQMDLNMRGEESIQEMEMTIVRPTWDRTIAMKSWSKGQDYSMILITEPAKERGQAFLKRDKEMWNWLPSIDRMIKIPPSMMMQSWMGSDFTNDDLVRESSIVKDFTHHLEGEETIRGHEAYRIRLDPKPDAAVVWGKILIWVGKEDLLELKAEFYDEDGYLVNTMQLSDIREMGGRKLPTHWEMIPADEEGKKTVLQLISADFTVDIEESFFSQQNLKRLR
ncbi:MAG TPA: outer membrane lipoprotein-sorting protein [Cytophagales bacterium]|jgi:outer membrane lipoprotein-sorting protein|nr:outer membrane lipoprotein-sorting protein [Cytophagales bacterium]